MARTLSNDLKAHFGSENTTLASCWKITRIDSTVMGFTDHVENIVYDSVTYVATSGFQPTDILQRDDMSVDNMEVAGILDSSYITESDIQAGRYDFASVEIFLLNYSNLTHGRMLIKKGWIGEVTVKRGQFHAEIRGLAQKLNQNIGKIFSPSCNAILGDTRCAVTVSGYTSNAITVTTVTDNRTFVTNATITDSTLYKSGELTWTTGNNANLKMEVKEFNQDSEITLVLPMPYTIQTGDTFTVVQGCDKSLSTCKNKFNNILNFRGFPDLPGQDRILETNGTFSG